MLLFLSTTADPTDARWQLTHDSATRVRASRRADPARGGVYLFVLFFVDPRARDRQSLPCCHESAAGTSCHTTRYMLYPMYHNECLVECRAGVVRVRVVEEGRLCSEKLQGR